MSESEGKTAVVDGPGAVGQLVCHAFVGRGGRNGTLPGAKGHFGTIGVYRREHPSLTHNFNQSYFPPHFYASRIHPNLVSAKEGGGGKGGASLKGSRADAPGCRLQPPGGPGLRAAVAIPPPPAQGTGGSGGPSPLRRSGAAHRGSRTAREGSKVRHLATRPRPSYELCT